MRKLKYGAVLLFAALFIVLGAFLPGIAAKAWDSASMEKVSYADMDAVQLDLRDEEEAVPEEISLTDAEKLALLTQKSLGISEVQEDLTKMTPEAVRLAAETALQPYIEQEVILTENNGLIFFCLPFLYYSENDPTVFNIVWDVTMANQDRSQAIGLLIDDETGKLLRINYVASGIYGDRETSMIVSLLSSLYFSPLDLVIADSSRLSASEFYTVVSIGEGVEKAVDIEFHVDSDGFFTILS